MPRSLGPPKRVASHHALAETQCSVVDVRFVKMKANSSWANEISEIY